MFKSREELRENALKRLTDSQRSLLEVAHAAHQNCDGAVTIDTTDPELGYKLATVRSLDVLQYIDAQDIGDGMFIVSLTDLGLEAKTEGKY